MVDSTLSDIPLQDTIDLLADVETEKEEPAFNFKTHFKFNSAVHNELVKNINNKVDNHYKNIIEQNLGKWRKAEQVVGLSSNKTLYDNDGVIKGKDYGSSSDDGDNKNYVNIPFLSSTLATRASLFSQAFTKRSPLVNISATNLDDADKADAIEDLINKNLEEMKLGSALNRMCYDGDMYRYSACKLEYRVHAPKEKVDGSNAYSKTNNTVSKLKFEGSYLQVISPYDCVYDTSVTPLTEVRERGEFIANAEMVKKHKLYHEQDLSYDEKYFNLDDMGAFSRILAIGDEVHSVKDLSAKDVSFPIEDFKELVGLLHGTIWLKNSDYKIASPDTYTLYYFTIANRKTLINFYEVEGTDRHPYYFHIPNQMGHTFQNNAIAVQLGETQKMMHWFLQTVMEISNLANIVIANTDVIDLENPQKLNGMTVFSRTKTSDGDNTPAFEGINLQNLEHLNLQLIEYLKDLMEDDSGLNDLIKGNETEKVKSATEIRLIVEGSHGRSAKTIEIMSEEVITPIVEGIITNYYTLASDSFLHSFRSKADQPVVLDGPTLRKELFNFNYSLSDGSLNVDKSVQLTAFTQLIQAISSVDAPSGGQNVAQALPGIVKAFGSLAGIDLSSIFPHLVAPDIPAQETQTTSVVEGQ